MTTTHDPSLLTDLHTWVCAHCFASGVISGADQDEAQKQHDAQNNQCHYHTLVLKPSSPFIREMHAALIAARAENKRRCEREALLIAELQRIVDSGSEDAKVQLSLMLQNWRALLQSEKGGTEGTAPSNPRVEVAPKKLRMETVEQSIASSLLDVEAELGGWHDGEHPTLEEMIALLRGALGKAEEYLEERQSDKGGE